MSTLYRKYRPQNFQEVIGQEVVVKTLQNALVHDVATHSYLLTGPRGTGKTSLARIFAKALNCSNKKGADACGKCAHCLALEDNQSLDIIEIDAASYTGVDNIRALRETMNNAPLLGRYKIYIIDEVHMLSTGAFNALLKIMEEPPSHVIFLLATTELHKVPKTILSRCQRFDLRTFTLTEIVGKLQTICKKEKIKIDDAALTLIAKNSGGALRDAESLLAQIETLASGAIDTRFVENTLGVSDSTTLYALVHSYCENNIEEVLLILKALEDAGKNALPLTHDLLALLRMVLLYKAHKKFDLDPLSLLTDNEQQKVRALALNFTYAKLTVLLNALEEAHTKIKGSAFGFLPLEIAFVHNMEASSSTNDTPPPTSPGHNKTTQKTEKKTPLPGSHPGEEKEEQESKVLIPEDTADTTQTSALEDRPRVSPTSTSKNTSLINLELVEKEWRSITDKVKVLNASLAVALQNAKPVVLHDNLLHIAVKYKFHQERLNEAHHQLTLQEAFDTILGAHLAFCIVPVEKSVDVSRSSEQNDPRVQHALELLGGTVL